VNDPEAALALREAAIERFFEHKYLEAQALAAVAWDILERPWHSEMHDPRTSRVDESP